MIPVEEYEAAAARYAETGSSEDHEAMAAAFREASADWGRLHEPTVTYDSPTDQTEEQQ